jgi:predicted transcriptional regulator
MASAGIRAQLLVARLQLQEQRVFAVARQLTDAQNALTVARLEIAGEQTRVRQLEEAKSRSSGPGLVTIQQAIREADVQIEQLQQREAQLRTRETELQRAVNDAQVRWTDFNDLLDQLDRSQMVNVAHQP